MRNLINVFKFNKVFVFSFISTLLFLSNYNSFGQSYLLVNSYNRIYSKYNNNYDNYNISASLRIYNKKNKFHEFEILSFKLYKNDSLFGYFSKNKRSNLILNYKYNFLNFKFFKNFSLYFNGFLTNEFSIDYYNGNSFNKRTLGNLTILGISTSINYIFKNQVIFLLEVPFQFYTNVYLRLKINDNSLTTPPIFDNISYNYFLRHDVFLKFGIGICINDNKNLKE